VPSPVWTSAPQLARQPMDQRSISYINNPAPANTQPHQMPCAIYSWNNRPRKRAYDEMEQEISNSSILNQQD